MEEVTSTAYLPPLRGAVLFAVGLNAGAVSVETLAEIAQVAENRARAFVSILVNLQVITDGPIGFLPGPEWEAWSKRPSRARPHKTSDRVAIDEMDRMRRSIAENVRREIAARGWSLRELARRAGIHPQYVCQITKYATPPPACHLVIIARTLGKSVEELTMASIGAQVRL